MYIIPVFVILLTFRMAVGVEDKVQNEPNPDIITLVMRILKRLDNMDQRFEKMDQRGERRFEAVNQRLTAIDQHLDGVDVRLNTMDVRLNTVDAQAKTNHGLLLNLEDHVKSQSRELKEVVRKSKADEQEIRANTKSVMEWSSVISTSLHNVSTDVKEVISVLTDVLPGKSEAAPADSCSWVAKHSYCARSGHFWIKDGKSTSLKYCKLDEEPVTTTTGPTTAMSTTEHPTTVHPTTTEPVHRGTSCKDLKKRYPHLKSGTYELTVGGKTFHAVCDMETDNGGWMMVGNAIVKREEEAILVDRFRIRSDEYSLLGKVSGGRFLLSTKGLNSLFNSQPFTEIRFFCHKPYHGRRLHLKTVGSDVVRWLLQRGSEHPAPASCGTFSRLAGDSSRIGADCSKWRGRVWYRNRVYDGPMIVDDADGEHYITTLDYYGYQGSLECDDHYYENPHIRNVGEWSWYVR